MAEVGGLIELDGDLLREGAKRGQEGQNENSHPWDFITYTEGGF